MKMSKKETSEAKQAVRKHNCKICGNIAAGYINRKPFCNKCFLELRKQTKELSKGNRLKE